MSKKSITLSGQGYPNHSLLMHYLHDVHIGEVGVCLSKPHTSSTGLLDEF
jgi:hypothetical protein